MKRGRKNQAKKRNKIRQKIKNSKKSPITIKIPRQSIPTPLESKFEKKTSRYLAGSNLFG
jgi:hypothetical protein